MASPWNAWNLQRVKAREAFAQLPGSPDGIRKPSHKFDHAVGQIDTGVTAHPGPGPSGTSDDFVMPATTRERRASCAGT